MVKVYPARAMTGRIRADVVKEARADKKFFEKAGITVLCPVSEENVRPTKTQLFTSVSHLVKFWKRDKEMIREAHVILDMTPTLKSEGVSHELGYARYFLWKPVVRVFPFRELPTEASIAYMEDDYVCDSIEEAVEYLYRVHGTWLKRVIWRLKLYNRSFLKSLIRKLAGWK